MRCILASETTVNDTSATTRTIISHVTKTTGTIIVLP